MKGESEIAVGGRLTCGNSVGIMLKEGIVLFNPSRRDREPESVNIVHWGSKTSPITALFLNKKKAIKCLYSKDIKTCDPRWRKETLEVLNKTGTEHPVFIPSKIERSLSCYF